MASDIVSSVPKIVPSPDTGYAWIVALACFSINFLLAGLARSAGVLYVNLIELYGITREVATAPFSIRVSVRNLTGPLVGMLGQRYGIRFVTSAGGFFAALGSILCYFAPDIFWITIFWGGIHGLGFGLSTVIHMMAINQHFDKYRATALGLAYTGDCVGTFVLPVLIDALTIEFGVEGTFLIIGGIVLNVIPLGLLLQTPAWLNALPEERRKSNPIATVEEIANEYHQSDKNTLNRLPSTSRSNWSSANIRECNDKVRLSSNGIPVYDEVARAFPQSPTPSKCISVSGTDMNTSAIIYEDDILENDECFYDNSSHQNKNLANSLNLIDNLLEEEEEINENSIKKPINSVSNCEEATETNEQVHAEVRNVSIVKKADGLTEIVMESRDLNCGNMVKTTITDRCDNRSNSILRIRTLSESRSITRGPESRSCSFHEHNIAHNSDNKGRHESIASDACQEVKFRKGNIEVVQNPVSSSIIISCNEDSNMQTIGVQQSGNIANILINNQPTTMSRVVRDAMKANLKPIFVLISVTTAAFSFLFIAVLTVIVDFGVDKGIPQELGKYLIIAFSATDLIGRVSFGVVIDKKWIPMKHYTAITLGAMGFIVAIIPLGSEFLTMLISMSFFGLAQSGVAIMFPILIAEYMAKNEESIAMGSLNFYGGLLLLGLAPLIGFFRDNYGSYDRMFYLVGLSCLAVGLIWFLEPVILKYQYRHEKKHQMII